MKSPLRCLIVFLILSSVANAWEGVTKLVEIPQHAEFPLSHFLSQSRPPKTSTLLDSLRETENRKETIDGLSLSSRCLLDEAMDHLASGIKLEAPNLTPNSSDIPSTPKQPGEINSLIKSQLWLANSSDMLLSQTPLLTVERLKNEKAESSTEELMREASEFVSSLFSWLFERKPLVIAAVVIFGIGAFSKK